ncbi:hypothetical protein GQ457_04G016580 [Hibiscus cannabinus]
MPSLDAWTSQWGPYPESVRIWDVATTIGGIIGKFLSLFRGKWFGVGSPPSLSSWASDRATLVTIMTISKDRVKPSPLPDSWKLAKNLTTEIVLGSYLAVMTCLGWQLWRKRLMMTSRSLPKLYIFNFCQSSIGESIVGLFENSMIFPIATLIVVYVNWSFAMIKGIGWGWAGMIWLYNIIFYIPLDFIKFFICYALSGQAWDLVIEQRIAFTRHKYFGKEQRELQWAHARGSYLHVLVLLDTGVESQNSET